MKFKIGTRVIDRDGFIFKVLNYESGSYLLEVLDEWLSDRYYWILTEKDRDRDKRMFRDVDTGTKIYIYFVDEDQLKLARVKNNKLNLKIYANKIKSKDQDWLYF